MQVLTETVKNEVLREPFIDFLLDLPQLFNFIDLAYSLNSAWTKADRLVKTLTCKSHEINKVFSLLEDSCETMEFVADLLAIESLDDRIKNATILSLLNFSYLPVIVNALVVFSKQ